MISFNLIVFFNVFPARSYRRSSVTLRS